MNIVLIDDDIEFLNSFKKMIRLYAKTLFDTVNIETSTDISILSNKIYTIYFLDIDLLNENGIDVAKTIKMQNRNAKIIFTTSKNDLVYNAISIQPFYFIRKSDLENDLATAFVLIKNYFIEKKYYSLKYENENIQIYIEDIIYFETNDHLTTIFTSSKQYHLYKPLKIILEEINSNSIIQVNRKQCVNFMHVIKEKKHTLILDIPIIIKIGPKYRNEVKTKLNNYINLRGKYDF